MNRILFVGMLLLAPIAFAADHGNKPTTKPIGASRVANGGFEQEGSWPFSAQNGCQGTGDVTTEQAHTGTRSYKITNKSGFAPNVYARAFQIVGGLEPFTTYRLSCYVKGKKAGICWIGGGPGWFHRTAFPKGTFDWTYVESLWTTDAAAGDYELMIATESETQAIYVDDVKFEPISVDVAKRDEVVAKNNALLVAQQKHFDQARQKIAGVPGAAQEPSITVGMNIARRYLDRVTSFPAVQSSSTSAVQLEEIDVVLHETEKELARFQAQGRKPRPLDFPTGGPVTIRDGVFYTDTTAGKDKPWYFYGMGHFDQVTRDLPFWHQMGATMIQDGRCGPNSMEKDGTLRDSARRFLGDMSRADLYGVKVDFLLSPHFFPDWGWAPPGSAERKGMEQGGGLGFLYFNIDHPRVKDAIGRWADIFSKKLQDHPALFSVCLSNEPVYDDSGKTAETLPLYRAYLKEIHHGDIAALNALYGTKFKSFDEVTPPGWGYTKEDGKNRAFYDWQRFNKKHFADWHTWMRDIVKKNLPNVPIHAKPMVFLSMNRDQMTYGVDPELFCAFSDIAGCDAYAFPDGDYKSYDWRGEEFWYDLLNSFQNQPVFNSENHIIPDGTALVHIPAAMTRAQYWQGALHHQGVTTTWVWEELTDPSLAGSVYFRPANAYGAGRAFVDLGHYAEEVAAINQAPASVAILFSQPSIFWQESYQGTCQNFYTHLNFLGQKTTFVSEQMLQTGRVPKVKWIALPQATHVEDATIDALKKFVADGGKIILIGDENLAFDQYHRPRDASKRLADSASVVKFNFAKEAIDSQIALRELLKAGGDSPVELTDAATGKLAWNVEYRFVEHSGTQGGATLVPIINFAKSAVKVKVPTLARKKALDLLSGETFNGDEPLALEPMVPMLLRVQ